MINKRKNECSRKLNGKLRKLHDERGNSYWGIDEDIRNSLRLKLMHTLFPIPLSALPRLQTSTGSKSMD